MCKRRTIGNCIGLIIVTLYILMMNDCRHYRTAYKHTQELTDTTTSLQQQIYNETNRKEPQQ